MAPANDDNLAGLLIQRYVTWGGIIWNIPVLALTGWAFLLQASLSNATTTRGRMLASLAGILVSVGCVISLTILSDCEKFDSEALALHLKGHKWVGEDYRTLRNEYASERSLIGKLFKTCKFRSLDVWYIVLYFMFAVQTTIFAMTFQCDYLISGDRHSSQEDKGNCHTGMMATMVVAFVLPCSVHILGAILPENAGLKKKTLALKDETLQMVDSK